MTPPQKVATVWNGAATWGGAWSTAETQKLVGTGTGQVELSIMRTGISPVSGEWANQVSALKTAKASGSNWWSPRAST